VVEALAETIIPSDSSGPGAKEAGVIYFIDRTLAGSYGKAGNMFMQGPFIHPQTGPVTIDGITYSGGTITPRLQAGTAYQYAFSPREFWRRGLVSLQTYCNSAYGAKFEKLTSSQQTTVLQDLFDNKTDNKNLQDAFLAPNAAEFFNDVHDLVTAGFWADPIYGGNKDMIGWKLLAFNANYWGDDIGLGAQKLMVASTPTRLPPQSLADLQKQGGGI
jgi:gluconate 2-dehydrogenase gamma chain